MKKIIFFCFLAFFSCAVLAVQALPAPIPVYLSQGFLLSTDQIYFIAVCLAVLGAGWITFS